MLWLKAIQTQLVKQKQIKNCLHNALLPLRTISNLTKLLAMEKLNLLVMVLKKPIATNKSKAGREMNRRVDIVIKPSQTASAAPAAEQAPATTNR
jgi:hypothetical protein